MKLLVTIFILFISITVSANDITIDITKNHKLIQTFSGKLGPKKGFQAYLVKNKETEVFELIPFFINNGEIKPLEKVIFQNKLSIVSYHSNNNTISLIIKEKHIGDEYYLKVLDIDTTTNARSITDLGKANTYSQAKTIFMLSDKTFIIYKKKRKLFFSLVKNSSNIIKKEIEISKDNNDILKIFFRNELFTTINSDDFVRNGSTSNNTIYFNNGNFYFINLNINKNVTNVLRINFNNLEDYHINKINNKVLGIVSDFNSYLFNNTIITVVIGKDVHANKNDAIIKITKLDNEKTIFRVSLINDLSSVLNNEMLNSFIKYSSRIKFKPTITINLSTNNNLIVNLDYVEKDTYYYHNNWNMHWMMQQQMRNMHSFGPNAQEDYFLISEKKNKNTLMQFALSKNFKILNNASTKTKYKNINIESYVDLYKKDKSKKSLTALFTDDNYFIIYFDKENKKIILTKKDY